MDKTKSKRRKPPKKPKPEYQKKEEPPEVLLKRRLKTLVRDDRQEYFYKCINDVDEDQGGEDVAMSDAGTSGQADERDDDMKTEPTDENDVEMDEYAYSSAESEEDDDEEETTIDAPTKDALMDKMTLKMKNKDDLSPTPPRNDSDFDSNMDEIPEPPPMPKNFEGKFGWRHTPVPVAVDLDALRLRSTFHLCYNDPPKKLTWGVQNFKEIPSLWDLLEAARKRKLVCKAKKALSVRIIRQYAYAQLGLEMACTIDIAIRDQIEKCLNNESDTEEERSKDLSKLYEMLDEKESLEHLHLRIEIDKDCELRERRKIVDELRVKFPLGFTILLKTLARPKAPRRRKRPLLEVDDVVSCIPEEQEETERAKLKLKDPPAPCDLARAPNKLPERDDELICTQEEQEEMMAEIERAISKLRALNADLAEDPNKLPELDDELICTQGEQEQEEMIAEIERAISKLRDALNADLAEDPNKLPELDDELICTQEEQEEMSAYMERAMSELRDALTADLARAPYSSLLPELNDAVMCTQKQQEKMVAKKKRAKFKLRKLPYIAPLQFFSRFSMETRTQFVLCSENPLYAHLPFVAHVPAANERIFIAAASGDVQLFIESFLRRLHSHLERYQRRYGSYDPKYVPHIYPYCTSINQEFFISPLHVAIYKRQLEIVQVILFPDPLIFESCPSLEPLWHDAVTKWFDEDARRPGHKNRWRTELYAELSKVAIMHEECSQVDIEMLNLFVQSGRFHFYLIHSGALADLETPMEFCARSGDVEMLDRFLGFERNFKRHQDKILEIEGALQAAMVADNQNCMEYLYMKFGGLLFELEPSGRVNEGTNKLGYNIIYRNDIVRYYEPGLLELQPVGCVAAELGLGSVLCSMYRDLPTVGLTARNFLCDDFYNSVFHYAVQSGVDLETLFDDHYIRDNCIRLCGNSRNTSGITALGVACLVNNMKAIDYLLSCGLNPNAGSPLELALFARNYEAFEKILPKVVESRKFPMPLTVQEVRNHLSHALFAAVAIGDWKTANRLIGLGGHPTAVLKEFDANAAELAADCNLRFTEERIFEPLPVKEAEWPEIMEVDPENEEAELVVLTPRRQAKPGPSSTSKDGRRRKKEAEPAPEEGEPEVMEVDQEEQAGTATSHRNLSTTEGGRRRKEKSRGGLPGRDGHHRVRETEPAPEEEEPEVMEVDPVNEEAEIMVLTPKKQAEKGSARPGRPPTTAKDGRRRHEKKREGHARRDGRHRKKKRLGGGPRKGGLYRLPRVPPRPGCLLKAGAPRKATESRRLLTFCDVYKIREFYDRDEWKPRECRDRMEVVVPRVQPLVTLEEEPQPNKKTGPKKSGRVQFSDVVEIIVDKKKKRKEGKSGKKKKKEKGKKKSKDGNDEKNRKKGEKKKKKGKAEEKNKKNKDGVKVVAACGPSILKLEEPGKKPQTGPKKSKQVHFSEVVEVKIIGDNKNERNERKAEKKAKRDDVDKRTQRNEIGDGKKKEIDEQKRENRPTTTQRNETDSKPNMPKYRRLPPPRRVMQPSGERGGGLKGILKKNVTGDGCVTAPGSRDKPRRSVTFNNKLRFRIIRPWMTEISSDGGSTTTQRNDTDPKPNMPKYKRLPPPRRVMPPSGGSGGCLKGILKTAIGSDGCVTAPGARDKPRRSVTFNHKLRFRLVPRRILKISNANGPTTTQRNDTDPKPNMPKYKRLPPPRRVMPPSGGRGLKGILKTTVTSDGCVTAPESRDKPHRSVTFNPEIRIRKIPRRIVEVTID